MAPVQLVSPEGLAFWPSGSGWLVEMIQSALPAVSAEVLSKSTRYGGVAAVDGLWRARLAPAISAHASRTDFTCSRDMPCNLEAPVPRHQSRHGDGSVNESSIVESKHSRADERLVR